MKKGDSVYTPRFCTCEISEVYEDGREAQKDGFYEPTHYDKDPDYEVLGKHTGINRMIFAAVRRG